MPIYVTRYTQLIKVSGRPNILLTSILIQDLYHLDEMTFAVLVSSIYLVSQETECSTLLTFIPRHDLTNELQKILECLQVNGLQSSCPYLQ
jgi:hypothetical protein